MAETIQTERTPSTEFGRRLRDELDRQNLSVRALARRMQPDNPEPMRRNIARWLSPLPDSSVNPSTASAHAAASSLGVSVETLLPDDDEEPV